MDGEWFTVYASEPRISTGGPPIRAVDLYGIGIAAEKLLALEACLLDMPGVLEMKSSGGDLVEVSASRKMNLGVFKGLKALLYVYGVFLNMEEKEFQCRISIDGCGVFLGVALEEFWRGERALIITELTLEQKIALVQAVVKREFVLVEKFSWIR